MAVVFRREDARQRLEINAICSKTVYIYIFFSSLWSKCWTAKAKTTLSCHCYKHEKQTMSFHCCFFFPPSDTCVTALIIQYNANYARNDCTLQRRSSACETNSDVHRRVGGANGSRDGSWTKIQPRLNALRIAITPSHATVALWRYPDQRRSAEQLQAGNFVLSSSAMCFYFKNALVCPNPGKPAWINQILISSTSGLKPNGSFVVWTVNKSHTKSGSKGSVDSRPEKSDLRRSLIWIRLACSLKSFLWIDIGAYIHTSSAF